MPIKKDFELFPFNNVKWKLLETNTDIKTDSQNGMISKAVGFFLLLWSVFVQNLKAEE